MNVKILDCTLRDGGYINNWDFGAVCIREVVSKLIAANIDIIEVGFLDSTYPVSANSTQFPHTDCLSNALPSIPATFSGSLVAMVMLGKCPI
ncbi:MAG: pyruvate carboxyltransferase, partial [Bacteroidales bacterium]|nr:pyruvate carboxyltransferase [Bacteroidales bacterium]